MTNSALEPIVDKIPEVKHMKMSRLEDSLFSQELAPHYMKLAGQLSSSELVPKFFRGKPQDLFICWAMGYQVGLSPEQAMQCIAVINGKPAMWGDDMLALCMAHKDFDDIIEEPIHQVGGVNVIIGYRCIVKRKGREPKMNEFTLEMAKKAKLLGKPGPWTDYPERMLKLRARGFTLRDAFPDALKGIKPREEVEDYQEVNYKIVDGSRTEFLKNDLLAKERANEEMVTKAINPMGDMENQSSSSETTESERSLGMGDFRESEIEPLQLNQPSSSATPQQCKTILKLIKQKNFGDERLEKALNYYEVLSMEDLTSTLAEHFIEQLNKL